MPPSTMLLSLQTRCHVELTDLIRHGQVPISITVWLIALSESHRALTLVLTVLLLSVVITVAIASI